MYPPVRARACSRIPCMTAKARALGRICAAALIGVGVVALTSCAPRLTLVSDPVFAEIYRPGDGLAHRASEGESGVDVFNPFSRSYRLHVAEADALEPTRDDVSEILRRSDAGRHIAVSPLLSPHAFYLADEFPDHEFLVLAAGEAAQAAADDAAEGGSAFAENGGEAGPENVARVVHDRRPAFRSLGERLAAELEAASGDAELVGFFVADSAVRRGELDAFEGGLGHMRERAEIVRFEDMPSASRLREELSRVRRENTRLVASFVGLHTDIVLDELGEGEHSVATADLGPGGAPEEVVSYSIERDFEEGVRRFLEGERGEIVVEAKVVLLRG